MGCSFGCRGFEEDCDCLGFERLRYLEWLVVGEGFKVDYLIMNVCSSYKWILKVATFCIAQFHARNSDIFRFQSTLFPSISTRQSKQNKCKNARQTPEANV